MLNPYKREQVQKVLEIMIFKEMAYKMVGKVKITAVKIEVEKENNKVKHLDKNK